MDANELLARVATETRVPVEYLVGPRRTGGVAYARSVVYYCVRELLPWMSGDEVGELLGGRDRSAYAHGVGRAEELYRNDERFAELVERICAQ